MSSAVEFWQDFAHYAPRLAAVMQQGELRRAFDAISGLLEGYGIDFCFDLSIEPHAGKMLNVLGFSPEGDLNAAEQIDAFLAAAPQLDGWRILGRRERKRPAEALEVIRHLYDVDASEARFVFDECHPCGPIADIYLPAAEPLGDFERHGLAGTFLWHLLGEELVMRERIAGRLIPSAPPEGAQALTIEELRERYPAK